MVMGKRCAAGRVVPAVPVTARILVELDKRKSTTNCCHVYWGAVF